MPPLAQRTSPPRDAGGHAALAKRGRPRQMVGKLRGATADQPMEWPLPGLGGHATSTTDAADGGVLLSSADLEQPPEAAEDLSKQIGEAASSFMTACRSLPHSSPPNRLSAKGKQDYRFHALWGKFGHASDESVPEVLENLQLRTDGGLDNHMLVQLWHAERHTPVVRCVSSMMACSMAVFNVFYNTKLDVDSILSPRGSDDGFHILHVIVPDERIPLPSGATGVTMLMELLLMGYLYTEILCMLAAAIFCPGDAEGDRWRYVSRVAWQKLPRLTTASAMRSLHRLHPDVFVRDLNDCFEAVGENYRSRHICSVVCDLLIFTCSRLLFLWIGLEVFLVKFRVASHNLNDSSISILNVATASMFLFQLLGIVNLKTFVQARLDLFVFGGSDAVLTKTEAGLQDVYYALLAKRLWRSAGLGRWRAFVVMTSFTDKDFQRLMLHEKARPHRSFAKICEAPF